MGLKAIVVGAGWAGEGHTLGLRAAGVEVVALCGRSSEHALKMAEALEVAHIRFDWRAALEEFQPDIVSIATPAKPHREIAEAAAKFGCHVVCEKPLAINLEESKSMLLMVELAHVKHAYAATGRYAPAVLQVRNYLSDGLIGSVREIECIFHADSTNWPYYEWNHQLSEGGGVLNNLFPHFLAQILSISGGIPQSVIGASVHNITRARVDAVLHDWRELFRPLRDVPNAPDAEWKTVDVDTGFTIHLNLNMPGGNSATVLFKASVTANAVQPNGLSIYGDQGTLLISEKDGTDHIQSYVKGRRQWESLPISQEILSSLPQVPDPVQRNWNQFFREFVADVRGEGYSGYLTFRDGWITSQIISAIRQGSTLTPILAELDR